MNVNRAGFRGVFDEGSALMQLLKSWRTGVKNGNRAIVQGAQKSGFGELASEVEHGAHVVSAQIRFIARVELTTEQNVWSDDIKGVFFRATAKGAQQREVEQVKRPEQKAP